MQGWGKTFFGNDIFIFRASFTVDTLADKTEVLLCDDVEMYIRGAKLISVCDCICRKRETARGYPCDHAMGTCLQFDNLAQYCVENGSAREIDADEAMQIVIDGQKHGMVV